MPSIQIEPTEPTFELLGIKLKGSFGLYFDRDKWKISNFACTPTEVSGDDLKKLA
jgi:hypothetical protein